MIALTKVTYDRKKKGIVSVKRYEEENENILEGFRWE